MEVTKNSASDERPFRQIGERIAQVRIASGLNKTKFAESCGVEQVTYLRYEEGQRSNVTLLSQIAEVYGIDLNWLILGVSKDKDIKLTTPVEKAEEILPIIRQLPINERVLLIQLVVEELIPNQSPSTTESFSSRDFRANLSS